MHKVSDYMLDYISEKNLSKEYLKKIKVPTNQNLEKYLEDMTDEMNKFLWEELHYKDKWKNIDEIKLSSMIKRFNLYPCAFWLTFCDIVKTSFDKSVYTLKF